MQNGIQLLNNTYQQIYGPEISIAHLDELAADLSQIAGRARPWTGKFLHSLLKGYAGFSINAHLVEALTILQSRLDGTDEVEAQASQATVRTVHTLPAETIILGEAQRCAAPDCTILFVPTHPRQKYHSKRCANFRRRQPSR